MERRKRLALFLPDFGGGGAERVALALIEGFVDRGYDVDLVLATRTGALLPLVPSNIQIFNLKAPKLRQAIWPLARYLRQRRPLAMHAMMWPLPIIALAARMIARVDTRLIGSEHVVLSMMPFALRHRSVRLITRLAYQRLNGLAAVSNGVAADMACLLALDRARIAVIYNPLLLPSDLQPATMIARWPAGARRLLAVGQFKGAKNYPLLLRAMKLLRQRMDASLLILGEGELLEAIRDMATDLGLDGAVVLPGFDPGIWPFFTSAEAFVLSSDYEGFGNVIIEALHAGLPVVSTDCPTGPREILDNGRFGTLTPCDDEVALAAALEKALTGPPPGAAARARAVELSGAGAIDRHLRLMTFE